MNQNNTRAARPSGYTDFTGGNRVKTEQANGKLEWPDFAARLAPHYSKPVAGPTATELLAQDKEDRFWGHAALELSRKHGQAIPVKNADLLHVAMMEFGFDDFITADRQQHDFATRAGVRSVFLPP
jgi:hypothetical protein